MLSIRIAMVEKWYYSIIERNLKPIQNIILNNSNIQPNEFVIIEHKLCNDHQFECSFCSILYYIQISFSLFIPLSHTHFFSLFMWVIQIPSDRFIFLTLFVLSDMSMPPHYFTKYGNFSCFLSLSLLSLSILFALSFNTKEKAIKCVGTGRFIAYRIFLFYCMKLYDLFSTSAEIDERQLAHAQNMTYIALLSSFPVIINSDYYVIQYESKCIALQCRTEILNT